jgi:hypothetical protein
MTGICKIWSGIGQGSQLDSQLGCGGSNDTRTKHFQLLCECTLTLTNPGNTVSPNTWKEHEMQRTKGNYQFLELESVLNTEFAPLLEISLESKITRRLAEQNIGITVSIFTRYFSVVVHSLDMLWCIKTS